MLTKSGTVGKTKGHKLTANCIRYHSNRGKGEGENGAARVSLPTRRVDAEALSYDVFSQESRAEGQTALDAVCIVGRK